MICVGLLLASASLGAMFWGHSMGRGSWQTMIFATLALSQMGNALAIRSDRESLFRLGLLSNRPLLGAVLLTVVLQGAVIYLPTMQRIFGTTSLTGGELAISVAFASIVFIVVEARKEILRLRERARAER
jgi:Ca2+-transporting ATPase